MINYLVATIIFCSTVYNDPQSYNLVKESIYQPQIAQDIQEPKIEVVEEEKIIDYIAELKKLGYYKYESQNDSLNIRNAILRFQSNYNLTVDGIWSDEEYESLNNRYNNLYFEYKDIVSEPATEGKWIVINKTKRLLTIYEDNKVLAKYPVAVGNPPSLTPEGKFKIVVKLVNPMWGGGGYADPVKGGIPENPLGYRWMGLSIGGGGEYGIHGNNKPFSIGTDASHGCVRMINSDVESIYDIIPNNTPVWIGYDETLKEWGISQDKY